MATDFDRDDRLHGVLRDTLRSQPVNGPCIDAATLAAWAEGALTTEETAATDTHLGTCVRCRELAATFASMPEAEGAPAAPVVPFRPRPNGRWKTIAGAMGAVAASVLIWVAVRDGSPSVDTSSAANRMDPSQARGSGGDAAPTATAPSRAAESATALLPRAGIPPEAEPRQGQQGQRALGTPRPEAKLARENTAPVPAPSPSSVKPSAAPVEAPARAAAPPAAMPPPPPQPVPAAPPLPATVGAARSSTAAGLPQSTINIAVDSSRPSNLLPPVIAEFAAGADRSAQQAQALGGVADRSLAVGAGRGGGGAAAVRQDAGGSAAAPAVQWRIHGPSPLPKFPSTNALSRSTDAGKTWHPVDIEATTPQLTAGSAPTNAVCWLAGRGGTVLLSTDGTTFRQVTKPADADLVSVRAVDARSATVRTADGRTFTTTDGGVTWTPRSDSPSQ